MSVAVAERRYALTRVRAGDYILPSNDGLTLWRIYSYEEDGSAAFEDSEGRWHTIRGTRWGTAKFNGDLETWERLSDPLSWEHWDNWHSGELTRSDAISAVLERP